MREARLSDNPSTHPEEQMANMRTAVLGIALITVGVAVALCAPAPLYWFGAAFSMPGGWLVGKATGA